MTSALQKIIAMPAVTAFQVAYTVEGSAYRAVVNGKQYQGKQSTGQTVDGWLTRVLARFVKISTTRVEVAVKDISRKEKHDDDTETDRKPEVATGSEGRDQTSPEGMSPPKPH